MQPKTDEIVDYYNSCECDYRTFWNLDCSMAMHAGFWDLQTKTLSDALVRENEVLADFAEIHPGDKVLDAGCGVGGSCIYLAKHRGCRVTGITLSSQQVDKAKKYASRHNVSDLVNFEVMNFCYTTFPDACFDVVWGIESICHAEDKSLFVKEAYRILKPGGCLIVADGFSVKEILTQRQALQMRYWLHGWGVERLETKKAFEHHLIVSGFSDKCYRNVTANVMPSSRRLYWISFPAIIYSKLGEWMGKRTYVQTQNTWAAYYQYVTLKKGLWEYGFLRATKKR
jgi:tocopherol O-methyltransferase